jgi:predicted ATPase
MDAPWTDPTLKLSQSRTDSGSLGGDTDLERLLRGVAQAAPLEPASGAETPSPPPTIGPYRILGPLGRGGMGIVYRAEHLETGRPAALKTVRSLREGLLAGLRREIQALTRIRHPGIVRILGQGVYEGLPWYAMERIEGPTLLEHCRRLGSLQEALGVVRRLCEALGYLHGEGIVHRDLKPGNVMLRQDGSPVLMDFGLISRFGNPVSREALEIGGGAGGTVAYMAPEQAQGRRVDARADLYSLGCILYEVVTGRPPFVGTSASEVLRQHFERRPLRPSGLAAGVPPELDALILKLLAKRPQERFGYADDVAAALGRLGAGAGSWPEAPRPRAYLYRPEFAGRAEVFEEIDRLLARLSYGAGALLLIGGESGVGKTRLLVELARLAQSLGIQVLAGESVQPLRPVLGAIADRCRERGQPETERLLGPRGKVLALYEPALADLPGAAAWPEPAELPAEAARTRLFRALAETLEALDAPVLLILDDLQLADELTLEWAAFLARSAYLERTRILVAGTYRSEEPGAELQKLLESAGIRGLSLPRLDPQAIGRMVGDMLALDPPPERFARFLARSSEGNPFFVAEYLRTALAEGVLYRDELGRWQIEEPGEEEATAELYEALPLPGSIQELVARRLQHLSEAGARLLEAAAVLGADLDEVLLAKMARVDGAAGIDAIEELLAQQFLEEVELGRLRFVHDKIREVAYARLRPERRRELHEAAARAMRTQPEPERERYTAALGRHWEQAGARDEARDCYLAAARKAALRYAHGEAGRLYRAAAALAQEASAPRLAALRELSADVLGVQGRHEEAIAVQLQALQEALQARDRSSQMISLRSLGILHRAVSRLREARSYSEQALALARELGDLTEQGRVLSGLTTLEWEQGHLEAAKLLIEEGLELSRRAGDLRSEGNSVGKLAVLLMEQGRLEEARSLLPQAIDLLHAAGDRRFEGMHLGNLANLHLMQGRFDEARNRYEQALERLRESGDRRMEGTTLSNLAQLHLDQGRIEEARAVYDKALAIHREVGNRRFEANTLRTRSTLERRSGDLDAAERVLADAESLLRQLGDPLSLAFCVCCRGHLELARGRPARAWLEQARQTAQAAGVGPQSDLGSTVARLERAVAAFEAGRPLVHGERAEDLPEALRRRLLKAPQAESVPDPV